MRVKKLLYFVGLLLFGGNLCAQEYPGAFSILKRNVLEFPNEAKEIAIFPVKHPKKTLVWAGITTALVITDIPTTKFIQQKIEPKIVFGIKDISSFRVIKGVNGYMISGLLGLYAGSVVFKYEKGQEASLNSLKATAFAYLYSHVVLKSLFARHRPHDNLTNPNFDDAPRVTNNWDFGNFHRPYFGSKSYGTSFPSFHLTFYFAVARALQRTFDNYWIPYTMAAVATLSSFEGHHHWVSDMAAGAMVGTMIGTMVTGGIKPKKIKGGYLNSSIQFVRNPFTTQQTPVISLSYHF